MEFVLTPDQMAAADRAAIEAGTPASLLMERAGWMLARSARDLLGGTYARRVTLVCGKGNNGGDGLVAARVLSEWGVASEVFRLDPELDRPALIRALRRSDLAVDAMFGTGFRGALAGDAAFVAEALADADLPVVACDIPSGVDGATGAVDGQAVRAVRTVCMAALKPGVLLQPGAGHAGAVEVAAIGVDPTAAPGAPAFVLDGSDIGALLPGREAETHKWAVGGLLVVAGNARMLGAAQLVARSALRAGAGIVVLGVPGEALAAQASGTEVVTLALPATPEGVLDEPAAKAALDDIDRFRALVVGPGLGTDPATRAAIRHLVAEAPVPLLLDADGLNALAGDLSPLTQRRAPTVLTPHLGEFNRLVEEPAGPDRLDAVRRLASESRAVVLLKGTTTLIAAPDGRAVFNTTGGPWLASAGTGDVLAGVIGALLAQGLDALEAAAVGAWLHGAAAGERAGPGLVAGDLVEGLPALIGRLLRGPRP